MKHAITVVILDRYGDPWKHSIEKYLSYFELRMESCVTF